MMAAAPTFRKQERMVSNLLIEALFDSGKSRSVTAFPLRAVYHTTERREGSAPVQVLISVPKKRFRHAVGRNRVKRQIREAYRHHKAILTEKVAEGKQLAVVFIWLADELYESAQVERSVKHLLEKVAERV